MNGGKHALRWVALAAADGFALLALGPDWPQLASELAAPHRWLERVGADQAAFVLALAALWCVAAWLGAGLLAIAAAALPGCAGAAARRVAARVVPAVLLRAVAGAAGFGVLVAPVAAGAKTPAGMAAGAKTPAGAGPIASVAPAPSWPTDPMPGLHIGWPTDPSPRPPSATAPGTSARRPNAPTAPRPNRSTPHGLPTSTAPHPSSSTTSRPRSATAPSRGGAQTNQASSSPARHSADQPVRVRRSDSLWLIAAQRLGPNATDAQIAATWPRWFAANRQVIGDDPSLIRPGQVLHAPPPPDGH